jgi:hypothetical protein
MSPTATPTTPDVRRPPTAGEAFSAVLGAALTRAATKVEHTVAGWSERLEGRTGQGSVHAAGAQGLKAVLNGENPFWPAVRAAWQAGGPVVRAAIVTAVVAAGLLLLVSPVLAVVFLVALLVIAAAQRNRTADK